MKQIVLFLFALTPFFLAAQPSPVFFVQNGFFPEKEWTFHSGNILYNQVQAGLSHRFSAGLGFATQYTETAGFNLSGKAGLYERGRVHLSAGFFLLRTWSREEAYVNYNTLYGAVSFGDHRNYYGFSTGWMYAEQWNYYSGGDGLTYLITNIFSDPIYDDVDGAFAPFAGFHVRKAGNRKVALVAEAYWYPQFFHNEWVLLLNPGLEIYTGKKMRTRWSVTNVIANTGYGIYYRPVLSLDLIWALNKRTRTQWQESIGPESN